MFSAPTSQFHNHSIIQALKFLLMNFLLVAQSLQPISARKESFPPTPTAESVGFFLGLEEAI
jgi:hypothetical protein